MTETAVGGEGPELLTAAQAAAERGVSASWMRHLIGRNGILAVGRLPGRKGANLYPADQLRGIIVGRQGARNDLPG